MSVTNFAGKASVVFLLMGLCVATVVAAADRVVHLETQPPLRKDLDAMPQIASPVDDAERAINTAVKRLDRNVQKAATDCKGDGWNRTVNAPMTGPGFLSFTIIDEVFCEGNAHPATGLFSIVYDLSTGKPVDWAKLLPASLVGKQTLEEQGDGTKIVTLKSKRLFALYMAGYTAEADAEQLKECKDAIKAVSTDGPPEMMVWLDAEKAGLAVQFDVAEGPCEETIVIPVKTLRAEGASEVLLKALKAAKH